MSKYVIDAWAWLEYLDGSEKGKNAKPKIENGQAFTSIITVSEVISKTARTGKDIEVAFDSMTSLSRIISADQIFAKEAGILHSQIKKIHSNFSFADAFVLQAAKNLDAKVLTGDPDFEGIKEAEMLR